MDMNRFTKAFIILTGALLLSWLLPWCYHFVFSKPFESPLTLYSPVTHDFMRFEWQKEDVGGYDMAGNAYTPAEFDSLMPTVNYFQLNRDNRLPKEIEGIPFNLRKVEHSNFVFRSFPRNYNRPQTGLYQMFDGATIKDGLKIPDEVFRMTSEGLEFIVMNTNKVEEELSRRFTNALLDKGFVFPARNLHYDDDVEKKYDNGFLLIDHEGSLFQLKRIDNQPLCRQIPLPDSLDLTHAFVTEYKDRRLLGFLRDRDGGFYALESHNLSLHKLPISPFDPLTQQMVISGDMFYWNVIRENAAYEDIEALDARDYHLVKTLHTDFPVFQWKKVRSWIFPFRLDFRSGYDRYMKPRFSSWSWNALPMGLLLALAWFFIQRRYRRHRNEAPWIGWTESVGVLLFGWYLFLPLLLTLRR